MNCDKFREHLSEYIDENLEPTTKALVEEHLSACKDCQQEVSSLRMLIDDLGSMEAVAPPKDFLDQLHRRMERRSWISQILYTLSLPMRVKLPMKLAGAVTMALLVFTILQIQEDQYGTKISPLVQEPIQSESSPPRMAKVPPGTGAQEETYSSGGVREKAKPAPQTVGVVAQKDEVEHSPNNAIKEITHVETRADHPLRKAAPVEMSLKKAAPPVQESTQPEFSPPRMAKTPFETGVQEEAYSSGAVREKEKPMPQAVKVVTQKDEVKGLADNAVKKIAHVEIEEDHPLRKKVPIELSLVLERVQSTDIFGAASDMETFEAREANERRRLTIEEPIPTTQLEREESINHFLPRLKEIIEHAGGEVVSVEYEEGTYIPESVHAEIPVRQIGVFQDDLQALGEFHGLPITPAGEDEEVIPIRIRLLTP